MKRTSACDSLRPGQLNRLVAKIKDRPKVSEDKTIIEKLKDERLYGMDLKEIKAEFGDCDWMRAFLNGYTVDAILWLINRVEVLEENLKRC